MNLKILLPFLFLSNLLLAQDDRNLPRHFTEEEKVMLEWQRFIQPGSSFGIPDPPPHPVRHMAEWEELQALAITWRSYPNILKEIVRHAKEEVKVFIVCRTTSEETTIKNTLTSSNITLDNIEFIIADNNSVWVRDYGPQCVYANDVDSLYFIDWIYNRPARPKDNVIPDAIGAHMNIPVFSTTEAPEDMVNTGGNFMSDGMGTAFASKLILEENEPGNQYGTGPLDEAAIDAIAKSYMGIDN
ncbi:MAG: agmatine deiminase family protein, partial [Bacteroidota bacterium]